MAIFQIWTECSISSTLHFMLVTLKPISSEDLLALESQMFPDCLYAHQHQESSSCSLVALCPCCPSRDCSANSPSWPRSPCQTSEFTLDPSLLFACMRAHWLQLCPSLCNPKGYSLPGSSVHGILQVRILEWVVMPSSRRSSQPQGSNSSPLCLLHWQADYLPLSHCGSSPFL